MGVFPVGPILERFTGPGSVVNIEDFGAVADSGVTDNHDAIMAAYESLPSVIVGGRTIRIGGTLLFPSNAGGAYPGRFYGSSPLNFDDSVGVVLQGFGKMQTAGSSAQSGSSLRYVGPATSSPFITARSSGGFYLDRMDVSFVDPAVGDFTGALIDLSHSSAGNDAAYGGARRSSIHGPQGVQTCRTLLNLHNAIFMHFEDVAFSQAQHTARLVDTDTDPYSNAHTFANCTHNDLAAPAFMNAAQTLKVIDNGFEGCLPYGCDQPNLIGYGITFDGGWLGDSIPAGILFDFRNQYVVDFNLVGGFEALGGAKGVVFGKGGRGIKIKAELECSAVAIDLGDINAGAGHVTSIDLTGAQLNAPIAVANRAIHRGIVQLATGGVEGHQTGKDLLTVEGHITSGVPGDAQPQVTASPAAGVGATISVKGNDIAGRIRIHTAGTPTAGVLGHLTFGMPYEETTYSWAGTGLKRPKITLTPANAAARACGQCGHENAADTGFDLAVQTAPAAGVDLDFDYHCIQ